MYTESIGKSVLSEIRLSFVTNCMLRRDHNKINVFFNMFSAALGWWTPGVGVDAIYRVLELVQMHTFTCVTRHFLLASKMTIASSFFAIAYSCFNAGSWNMSCTKVGLF